MKWYHILSPILVILIFHACVHEPIIPQNPGPRDTIVGPVDTTVNDTMVNDTMVNDTMVNDTLPPDTTTVPNDTTTGPGDTTTNTIKPCDPDTVYFSRDILPILISNCAKSGCHDAASAQDNVVLTDYQLVIQTGDIVPGNLFDSDLYEVLVEDDPDKKMPPPPNSPLANEQLLLIQTWILQGAQDLSCGDSTGSGNGCDTLNVSFSQTVMPILNNTCTGCHNSNGASGGIYLSTHAGVASAASSGKLYGAIAHLNGFSPMPQGGNQLPSCDIKQIKAWIDEGALDN